MAQRNTRSRATDNIRGAATKPAQSTSTTLTPRPSTTTLSKTDLLSTFTDPLFINAIQEAIKPITELLSSEIRDLKNTISQQDKALHDAFSQLKLHENRICQLEQQLQNRQNGERQYTLRVTGLAPDYSTTHFINTVKDKMNIDLVHDDVSVKACPARPPRRPAAAPSGSTDPTPPSPPPVTHIATFSSVWKRRDVYSSRTKLRGTGIFLAEDLTKEEGKLAFLCRQKRKDKKIKSTWTFNHKIYIRTLDDTQVCVTSEHQLQQLTDPDFNLLTAQMTDQHNNTARIQAILNSTGSSEFLGFPTNHSLISTR